MSLTAMPIFAAAGLTKNNNLKFAPNLVKNHAISAFHRPPENLNCAQAVLDAYQTISGRHVTDVASFKPFGGGRAPDNECGALYAACQAAPESAATLRAAFEKTAGSTRCRELKQNLRYPCTDCVGLAAGLLQQLPQAAKQPIQ